MANSENCDSNDVEIIEITCPYCDTLNTMDEFTQQDDPFICCEGCGEMIPTIDY